MATEEELRAEHLQAQILKTKAETELAQEQLHEHKRSSHIIRRVSQGLGVGLVLALAGMALFGPIKETFEAESKLATLNAEIANRTTVDLQQRLDERKKQLEAQEQRYTKDLEQLAKDLKKANEDRDAAIKQRTELAEREKDLAADYSRLASQQQDNVELAAQAEAATARAQELEATVANLEADAAAAKANAAQLQTRLDVRPLSEFDIRVGDPGVAEGLVLLRLKGLGLTYSLGSCIGWRRGIYYYSEDDEPAAILLAGALDEIMRNAEIIFVEDTKLEKLLVVCAP